MTQSLTIHTTKGSCKANRLRLKVATSQEEKQLVIKGKCHDYCSYTILDACVLYYVDMYTLVIILSCSEYYINDDCGPTDHGEQHEDTNR